MKKIIVKVNPFLLKQEAIVYEDGNKIDIEHFTVQNLKKDFPNFIRQHNPSEVVFIGAKKFAKGLISKEISTNFEKNNIKINFM